MKKIITTLLTKLGFANAVTTKYLIKTHLEELLGVDTSMTDDTDQHSFMLSPQGFDESFIFDYVEVEGSTIRIVSIDIISFNLSQLN